jgi:proton glutamate symport protein
MKRKILPSLTVQIFIGLVVGIIIGAVWPQFGASIKPVADIFLRMIKMIIAPLLFATLVVGTAGSGNFKTVGRIGLKALIYFEVATTIALLFGLLVVNYFRPGDYVTRSAASAQAAASLVQPVHKSGWDFVVEVFPTSVIDSMGRGDILQVVVFALFFGLALAAIGDKGKPLLNILSSLAEVMYTFTNYVMAFAPIGVTAAIASIVGAQGLGVLKGYASLVICFYGALIVFVFVVLALICVIIKVPFWRLFKAIKEPFTIAFTTSSGLAALPTAMTSMERFGCPKEIVGFVLPTGFSFNLDGATLYLSLASIFIAQVFGIPLDFKTQLAMMLTLMLTSKGVAGVPRASLVVLAGTVTAFNLPMEGVALLLGVDQILDMGRTAVNVTGNCVAAAVVSRWEGVLDDKKMMASDQIAAEAVS